MNPLDMPPQADGLYDPRYEHDACGVALVARLDNRPSHEVVEKGLTALENLEHRGAAGADKHINGYFLSSFTGDRLTISTCAAGACPRYLGTYVLKLIN